MIEGDTTRIDTLSLVPRTFEVKSEVEESWKYMLDEMRSEIIYVSGTSPDSVQVTYRVFPYLFTKEIRLKDRALIRKEEDNSSFDPGQIYTPGVLPTGYNASGSIYKSGYLSRGIRLGNAQDLSVNSDLNLQLTGYLTSDLQLLASISDANIPIQPGGNSQTLQDFDRVYINVFNNQFSLTGGDYILRSRPSSYLQYFKRAQGLNVTAIIPEGRVTHDVMASAAISKGKYARNIFTATEGNQGPYRLTGAEGEAFVIILAGTERVYIDGKLMKRGEEFDYTIDYNAAELTFTPNQLITKDKRIQVEFQYSDKNYARSIFQVSDHIKGERFEAYLSVYSEQDAKNQSLQQVLEPEDKGRLAAAGDDLSSAAVLAIDSTGFTPEGVHYLLTDSLGYDSVFVFSTDENIAHYTLGFSEVGSGNGDYIQSGFSANGRVFEWVAPDTVSGVIQRNGSFIPYVLLIAPKKQQVIAGGWKSSLSKGIMLRSEAAMTVNDQNTFSSLDADDDKGYSGKVGVDFSKDSLLFKDWQFTGVSEIEYLSEYFNTTERFRSVEFIRDWNLLSSEAVGRQVLSKVGGGMSHRKKGSIAVTQENFLVGEDYTGNKSALKHQFSSWQTALETLASYLSTSGATRTDFYRHRNNISYSFKPFRVGYEDEVESNSRTDTLGTGYRFADYQFYIMNADSTKNRGKIFYRQRIDEVQVNSSFTRTAKATQIGGSYEWLSHKTQSGRINVSRRELIIEDTTLTNQAPESTILGRIEYRLKAFKNAFISDMFYQVGSGLEQKREYIYLEVPAGQGVYIWNDYNEDGIRDINEFEIAAFSYEANFIRTFIPSNEYERVHSNGFNVTAGLDFQRIWKDEKGWKKFLSKWSYQFSASTDRKTTDSSDAQRYHPLLTDIDESSLRALNSAMRNTVFFNKLSTRFGADFTVQENASKVLLSNGLESRLIGLQRVNLRWNYSKAIIVKLALSEEQKSSVVTNVAGRDYEINTSRLSPEVSYQPNSKIKVSGVADYANKENGVEEMKDRAELLTLGVKGRYSVPGAGAIEAEANTISVSYDGESNTAVAFEMLDGLNTGTNYTWSVSIQQNLNKNIQLSVNYFGRKSEENPFIHSGGIQVRALF